jgi:hypothetical protein
VAVPALRVREPVGALSPQVTAQQAQQVAAVDNWDQIEQFYAQQPHVAFTGFLVDNRREGNTIVFNLIKEETETHMTGVIELSDYLGRVVYLDIYARSGQYRGLCTVQFADMDGDGTDEIILFFGGESGRDGDLHVMEYKGGVLRESFTLLSSERTSELMRLYAGTLYNEYAPRNAALFMEDNTLYLRVQVDDTTFLELDRGGGLWLTRKAAPIAEEEEPGPSPQPFGQAEQRQYIKNLLPGIGTVTYAHVGAGGMPIDLRGIGVMNDILYFHQAIAGPSATVYLLLEVQRGKEDTAPRELLHMYEGANIVSYDIACADLDGDGGNEIFVGITRGVGEGEVFEMHVLDTVGGTVVESLTFFSQFSMESRNTYRDTLVSIPNAAGMARYADQTSLQVACRWAEVVSLADGPCVQLLHLDSAYNTVAISRVRREDGAWALIEQGEVAAGARTVDETALFDDEGA